MQVVLVSLMKALPGIVHVALLVFIFWFMFAILGVTLFKGKLRQCSVDALLDAADCVTVGGQWDTDFSFDST